MSFVLIDFETRSHCDLKKSGAWVYAQDPTTEVICLGYSIDGAEAQLWRPDLLGQCIPSDLKAALARSGCKVVAHNAIFERAVWDNIMVPQYGWAPLTNPLLDTMAGCAYRALPLKLEKAAQVLQLPQQKGSVGLRYFKPAKDGSFIPPPPELFAYCQQDVRAEVDLFRAVRIPPKDELAVYFLDQTINTRGCRIDTAYVAAAQAVVEGARAPALKEFADITGGLAPTQRDKVLDWLMLQGVVLPDMRAETIKELLQEEDEEYDYEADVGELEKEASDIHLPADVRRALEIRGILGSASIKKLARVPYCVGNDGRVRGLLQYHGASTGRWTGRLLQPQNFPRGELSANPPDLVDAILTRDHEYVGSLYGEPIKAVAAGLRHMIVPSRGNALVVGDFNTIECRIVLALAGQYDKVEMLARGESPYPPMAELIYGYPVTKKDNVPEYTIGKNTVLGCGFQMGHKKFRARYAKTHDEEFCKNVVRTYRQEFAPEVPALWEALGDAARSTVITGRSHSAYGIEYRIEEDWLTARCPDGSKIWYFGPHMHRHKAPWSTDEEPEYISSFAYWTQKSSQWRRVIGYGGMCTANVVQHLARQLLCNAALKCEAEGMPLVLTVHDENVCDVPLARADEKVLEQIMTDRPAWAIEMKIPVAAECWAGDRYRK